MHKLQESLISAVAMQQAIIDVHSVSCVLICYKQTYPALIQHLIYTATHWVSTGDYTMEHDNVRVSELSHDGSFLEELDFVLL